MTHIENKDETSRNRDFFSKLSYRDGLLICSTLTAIGLMFLYAQSFELVRLLADPEFLRQYLQSYGSLAALILFGLLILNNIVWFIPGHGLGVACGLIYGPVWGTLLCFTGTFLSTIIAVLISKKWGRSFVVWMIGEEKFKQYEALASSKDLYPFAFLIITPIVPDDAMVYLAGLTNIDTKRIVIWLSIARLPGVVALTWFGQGIATQNNDLMISLGGIVFVAAALSLWKRETLLSNFGGNDGTRA